VGNYKLQLPRTTSNLVRTVISCMVNRADSQNIKIEFFLV